MSIINLPPNKKLFVWTDVNDETHLVMAESRFDAIDAVIREQVAASAEMYVAQNMEPPSHAELWDEARDFFDRHDEVHEIHVDTLVSDKCTHPVTVVRDGVARCAGCDLEWKGGPREDWQAT